MLTPRCLVEFLGERERQSIDRDLGRFRLTRVESQEIRELFNDATLGQFVLHVFILAAKQVDGIASVDKNIFDRRLQHAR